VAFTRVSFLGASVRGFNTSIGWNANQSSLSVQLVEDAANGDTFSPPDVGTPVHFTFGSFRFSGLLQKWEKKNETQGLPTYEAVVVDPRELLEGIQVVIGQYSGSVAEVQNVVNAYGYWENTGYGNSGANNSGMTWARVRDAIKAVVNQPTYTTYGGPITFRGVKYAIDLSQVPNPPAYYRVGGGASIGLLDLLSQICDDGGCDFFVELVGTTIRIRTVSRANQPPLGTISAIANTNWGGTVVRSHNGLELRNETTSAFLVGGQVSTLHQTTSLTSFWGYDVAGNPILGTSGRFDFVDSRYLASLYGDHTATDTELWLANFTWPAAATGWPSAIPFYVRIGSEIIKCTQFLGTVGVVYKYKCERGAFGSTAQAHANLAQAVYCWGSTPTEYANLNSSKIADLIGTVSYTCSTLEMRLALIDFQSWSAFLWHHRPDIATALNLYSPLINPLVGDALMFPPDLVGDAPLLAELVGAAFVSGEVFARQQTVYEFVRAIAQTYLGKKYVASVPFVLHKQDPETLVVSTSYDVADGGYLPEGSTPLGLSTFNEDTFKNQDGTFRAFVTFSNLTGADLANISPNDSVVEDGVLYQAVQVDPNLVFVPSPAVVITVPEGLFDRPVDVLGSVDVIAGVLLRTPAEARAFFEDRRPFGSTMARVFPAQRNPSGAAVPLRSNILTYGPWYAQGAVGKVRFEVDPTLVPWEYGGYSIMDQVGTARVIQSVTNMQVGEVGSLELAGAPLYSLGDTMQSGGPNVTNMQVSFGTQGVTTSYQFATYTPRFGVFSKGQAERMKKLGQTTNELRRALRASSREAEVTNIAIARAVNARRFMGGAPPAMDPHTPHEVLIARNVMDPYTSGVRVGASTSTYIEAVPFMKADSETNYKSGAVMSMAGLVRPFATKPSLAYLLPGYVTPLPEITGVTGFSQKQLDPWKRQNDIDIYSWGETYEGLNAHRRTPDISTKGVKALGLRGPLVLVGWGYDTDGGPVPNLTDGNTLIEQDGGFASGYLNRSDWWKAGPVDMLFDRERGVWTVHDIIRCEATGYIPIGGSGYVEVKFRKPDNTEHTVKEQLVYTWTNPVVSGQRLMGLFVAHDRKWYVIIPDSGGSSSGSGATYTFDSPEFTVDETDGNFHISAEWGTGILPVGWANDEGSGEYFARVDHVHEHPVFDSGNLHPEYIYTFGAEFDVNGDGPRTVEAVWGTSIQSIGAVNDDGVEESFARSDHSHEHPVFVAGDLHPEYNLPAGLNNTVLHKSGGSNVWSATPTITGVYLGDTATDGFVALAGEGGSSRTYLKTRRRDTNVHIFLPSGNPFATGQVLVVDSYDANNVYLAWGMGSGGISQTIEYVSNVTCGTGGLEVTYRQMTFDRGLLIGEW